MKRLIDTEELLKAVANANIESPEDAMEIIDHAPDAYIVGLETLNAMVQAAYKAGREGKPLMVALNEEVRG